MLSCFNNCRVIVEYCVGIELSAQACSPGDGRFGKFFGMNIHCTSVGSQGSTKKNSEFIPFRYEQYFFSQYFSNRKTNDSLQLFFSLLRHCYDATYNIFSSFLKWNYIFSLFGVSVTGMQTILERVLKYASNLLFHWQYSGNIYSLCCIFG